MKIAHIVLHLSLPMTIEAEGVHLVDGLFGRPVIEGHAVRGDEDAGAIFSIVAVNKNGFGGVVAKNREKLNNLRVGWSGKTTHGNVHETQTKRFDLLTLGGNVRVVFETKIYDGGDAHFLQFGKGWEIGLCATVEVIVHFSGIGNPFDVNFFGIRRSHHGGGRRTLWKGWKTKNCEEKKRGKQRETFHLELDASYLASVAGEKRAEEKMWARRKGTTT